LRAGAGGGIDRALGRGSIYWLKPIFGSDPDLALAWLEARLEDVRDFEVVSERGVYASAIEALREDQRGELIRRMAPGYLAGQLLPLLIRESTALYSQLLAREALRPYHLEPLAGGTLEGAWWQKAELALKAGHTPQDIAHAAFLGIRTISGFGEEYWEKRKRSFEAVVDTAQGGLREVAEDGRRIAEGHIAHAQKRKRELELTGRF
jgi:hypothetical protein